MGHVRDRWTDPNPNGSRPKRVPNSRWGKGKRWQARWVDAGGAERARAFDTADEARTHLALVEVGAVTPAATAAAGLTFGAWTETWMRQQIQHAASTRRQTASRLNAWILPAFADRPLSAITRAEVQAAVADWSTRCAPGTVRSVYQVLAQVLAAAAADQLLEVSPADRIKLPKRPAGRVVPLTPGQVEAITAAFSPHLASMVTVGAATGARIGELRGLTVDRLTATHVRFDRQLALEGGLVWGPLKTAASDRRIALGAVARKALDQHLDKYGTGPGGLVWRTRDNRPLRHQATQEAWAYMKATHPEIGLRPRSGWHDLRHFQASLLIARGLSPRAVADRLGHGDPAITLRTYAHLWPTDEADAVAAIDAALG